MQARLLSMMVSMLLRTLTPNLLKKFIDMALDFVENYVLGTASTVDDTVVLPICSMIRTALDVPDND